MLPYLIPANANSPLTKVDTLADPRDPRGAHWPVRRLVSLSGPISRRLPRQHTPRARSLPRTCSSLIARSPQRSQDSRLVTPDPADTSGGRNPPMARHSGQSSCFKPSNRGTGQVSAPGYLCPAQGLQRPLLAVYKPRERGDLPALGS